MANEEEPREPQEESGGPEEGLSQDPFVEKVRPDPAQPPIQVRVLQGLMGESDREGYWRLYFTRELDSYAEFRQEDVLYSEPIPSEQPPFVGLDATRVGIRRDAAIEYTLDRVPRPVDEFDLDIRLGGAPSRAPRGDLWHTEFVCTYWPCVTEDNFTCSRTCWECRALRQTDHTCADTCDFNCIPTELPPHLCRTRFGHAC